MASETKLVSGSVEKQKETVVEKAIIGKIVTYEITESELYALTEGNQSKTILWILNVLIGIDVSLWITCFTVDFSGQETKESSFLTGAIIFLFFCAILSFLYNKSKSSVESLVKKIINRRTESEE